jgi:glycine/D-amino acid oxidase-like deaminating enzyme
MKTVDYLIIGQGLSGTCVAQKLVEAKKSILVIDELRDNQASRVASGIWNPISFKRLSKVWLADEMIPALNSFYAEAEQQLTTDFTADQHMHRVFASRKEIDEWLTRCDNPAFDGLMDEKIIPPKNPGLNTPSGLGRVSQSGRIDTAKWLDAARSYFLAHNLLIEAAFDFEKLELTETGICYEDVEASGIIFCEGMYAASQNPYFSYLPFRLTKGEVLTIYCPNLNLSEIVSGGVFILPLGGDLYKVGATYDWDNLDFEPTDTARKELVTSAKKILDLPFNVVAHEVGIRPTVRDRRPFIGTHPEHKQLHIFNGMGSRGVLIAPLMADDFVRYLETGEGLHREANIARLERKS